MTRLMPGRPPAPTPSLPASTKTVRDSVLSHEIAFSAEEDAEMEVNELPLTSELIETFKSFLELNNVELRFFVGSWHELPIPLEAYSIVLTSETVYELDNLPYLTDLLHQISMTKNHPAKTRDQLTLVACKRVYFGVGGGEFAFKAEVGARGEVNNIWHSSHGVERTVLRVEWDENYSKGKE